MKVSLYTGYINDAAISRKVSIDESHLPNGKNFFDRINKAQSFLTKHLKETNNLPAWIPSIWEKDRI